MQCPVCNFIKSKEAKKIYEDQNMVAVLSPNPSSIGHTLIIPKQHFTILEELPNYLVAKLFQLANKVSAALFQSLDIKGTNILVNNGVSANQKYAHFMINVIPRTEGDGLNFAWTPKQLNEEKMSTVELMIKSVLNNMPIFEKEKQKPIVIDEKKPLITKSSKDQAEHKDVQETEEEKSGEKEEDKSGNSENYLIRHLRRIP